MLLLAVAVLLVYWPATRGNFVLLDDGPFVARNPHVLTGLQADNIRWAFTTVHESWWLPLLWLSFMMDVELFGTGPFGFHLTNVLLHVANTLLLGWTLFRLTGSRGRSLFVAALFALHPLRVESVAWITARKDVLSGFFLLLALAVYARRPPPPGGARRAGIAALMGLGLMAKATVIVLPVLLLLLDFWPLQRLGTPLAGGIWKRWRPLLAEKIPLLVLALLFIALNLHTHQANVLGPGGPPGTTRLALMAPNVWAYVGKICWPANLTVYYPERDFVLWPLALASAAGLLGVTALALRLRSKAPYFLVGWLWFLAALLPVVRGLRLGPTALANRFTYLPAIGLAIAAVWAIAEWTRTRPRLRRGAIALGTGILLASTGLTIHNLAFWRNSETLFQHALSIHPENFIAAKNLADHYAQTGRPRECRLALERTVSAGRPHLPASVGVVGDALRQLGRIDEAGEVYAAALDSNPQHAGEILNNLGLIRFQQGRHAESVDLLRQGLAADPGLPDARFNLGMVLFQLGRTAEALQALEQALRMNPQDHAAHYLCGQALLQQGRPAEAQPHFEAARRLQPANPDYRAAARPRRQPLAAPSSTVEP